jgi:hypothetical protein
MGGQVEQGMFNIESFLPFKIGYSAFIIQYSFFRLSDLCAMRSALDPLNP